MGAIVLRTDPASTLSMTVCDSTGSASIAGPQLAAITEMLRAAGCVFAEQEAALLTAETDDPAELTRLVQRRATGEPLETVVGWARFSGYRIEVAPGVFVPRPRSEVLVAEATARSSEGAIVVELCCGTAAIGLAVGRALHGCKVFATDVDEAAVACANRNLVSVGGQALLGDLYDPLPDRLTGTVDLIVANAPYVPTAEIETLPREARCHAPRVALDGGADGTEIQARVAVGAPQWLAPGGHLLIETGSHQASRTAEVVTAGGLIPTVVHHAEMEMAVVVGSHAPPDGCEAGR